MLGPLNLVFYLTAETTPARSSATPRSAETSSYVVGAGSLDSLLDARQILDALTKIKT